MDETEITTKPMLSLGLPLGRSLGLPIGKGGGFSETNGRAPDAGLALGRERRAKRPLYPGKNGATSRRQGRGASGERNGNFRHGRGQRRRVN